MKKRLLAFLLVLTLLASFVPVGVVAEEQTDIGNDEIMAIAVPEAHSHGQSMAHDCIHCTADTVEWTAWGDDEAEKKTLPVTTGHYYLVADVAVTAQQRVIGTNDVVLCLNGWNASGSKSACVYRIQDTAKLTVSDCTAYTDEDGNLVAGAVCDGKNKDVGGAFYALGDAQLTVQDIRVTGHQNAQSATSLGWSGGAIHGRGNAVIHLKGLELTGNSTSAEGGAICLRDNVVLTMEKCVLKNNTATRAGGAIYIASKNNQLTATECVFEGNNSGLNGGAVCTAAESKSISFTDCIFKSNTATSRGGALFLENTTAMVTGGEIRDNSATNGGGMCCTKGNNTIIGTKFTGNIASNSGGSAFYLAGGSGKVRMENVTITGNQSTNAKSANCAGVYITNKSDKLTLAGKCEISGNMIGVGSATEAECNIFLQNEGSSVNLDGLAEGTDISIRTGAGFVEDFSYLNLVKDPTSWNKKWISYENGSYAVDYDLQTKTFSQAVMSDHIHCACGEHHDTDENCQHGVHAACDHAEIAYIPWESTNSLPKDPGNYYLTGDVVVPKETPVSTNSGIDDVINLCLNGYDIRVDYEKEGNISDQIFYITRNADLTISDCTAHVDPDGQYQAGKLTGGTRGVATISITGNYLPTAKFTLYDGILTGNTSKQNGGAVNMTEGESVFAMHGGLITANATTASGGAVFVGKGNTFLMTGGEISGNSGKQGGGVYIAADAKAVTLGGDSRITGNIAGGTASNLYLDGDITVQVDKLTERACVGISADPAQLPRQISSDKAPLTGLTGDSQYRPLELQNDIVYMTISKDHSHCDCGGGDLGCDHTAVAWMAWENPNSLPSGSGYYYLVTDVTVTSTSLNSGDLHLCLNGHTVTANGEEGNKADRIYTVALDGHLTIADCTAVTADGVYTAGKLTGGSYAAIFVPNQSGKNEDGSEKVNNSVIRLYDGILTGNTTDSYGGAIGIQDGAKFYMYGGCISGNTAKIATAADGTTSGGYGSALYLGTNAVFEMHGGSITGNTAEHTGAVYVTQSAAYIKGGSISGNTAVKNAGAVMLTGDRTVMEMSGGEISGNKAQSSAGGILAQAKAQFHMTGGEISGNTTEADGGGVYISTNSSMTMTGGEISGNISKGKGGGINLFGATFTMEGGSITGNSAKEGAGIMGWLGERKVDGQAVRDVPVTITVKDGQISKNMATNGGGILLTGKGAVLNLEGGKISENAAESGAGILTQGNAHLEMTGGAVSGNKSTKGGAGVYLSYTTTMNMTGGEISGNAAQGNGGGMYVLGAVANLKGGKISGNDAKTSGGGMYATHFKKAATATSEAAVYTSTLNLAGVTVSGNHTAGNGAGVCTSNSTLINMTGGAITSNKADKAAGGILIQSKSQLKLSGGSISYNAAKNGGGAYISTNTKLTMTGGSITGNTSTASCAGLYLLRSEATLAGGTISQNVSETNAGGIYVAGGNLLLTGTTIRDNEAKSNGGGICTTRHKVTDKAGNITAEYFSTMTMAGGVISGNKALNGGGILLQNKTQMVLEKGTIENNYVTKAGGGIYVSTNCNLVMHDGLLRGNESVASGAAIYHYRSTGEYHGGTLTGNIAGNAGAGMLLTGVNTLVTIKNLAITDNKAINGGGIVVQGQATADAQNLTITGNTVENDGGAIYISSKSNLTLDGGDYSSNISQRNGGAIFTAPTAQVHMSNCTIKDNQAVNGGGIYNRSNLYLTNVEITGNRATEYGGGIATGKTGTRMFMQPDGLVTNGVTVENNTAGQQGGGMYLCVGCPATLQDTWVANNTAAAEGGGIWAIYDTTFQDVTITDNTSGGEGYALYLAACEYDGESYVKGLMKIGGVVEVDGNENGDMYIGEQTTVSIDKQGLAEGSKLHIKLHSGLLTQTLYGAYNYEGSNCEYIVTAGNRSLTNPEYDAAYNDQFAQPDTQDPTEETQDSQGGEKAAPGGVVYIVIGAFVVAAAAVIGVAAVAKKKKAASAAKE